VIGSLNLCVCVVLPHLWSCSVCGRLCLDIADVQVFRPECLDTLHCSQEGVFGNLLQISRAAPAARETAARPQRVAMCKSQSALSHLPRVNLWEPHNELTQPLM
jgi:hypothetical protein